MNTRGRKVSISARMTWVRRNVQAVYIPRGKTAPQYSGSYRSGNLRYPCRQAPRMTNIGTHHVAVDQKSSVSPWIKGSKSLSRDDRGAAASSIVPAKVEIATAPMLIQYGGARSDGLRIKKVYR